MNYDLPWNDLNEEAKSMILQRIIYVSGFSRTNFPVIKIDVKRINLNHKDIKECFLQAFCFIINYSKKMKECSQEHKFIFILESDRMSMFSFPFSTLKRVIDFTSEQYPNHLHRCLILNPSSSLYIVWSIIDLFIHSSNKQQVKIVKYKETLSTLQDYIDQQQIETRYGGMNSTHFYPNIQNYSQNASDQDQQNTFKQCYFMFLPFLLFNKQNMGFKNEYQQQSSNYHRLFRSIKKIIRK